MLDKITTISLNGLFGGIIDSSSVPLGLVPGDLLFRLADDWQSKQVDVLELLENLLVFFQEKVNYLIKSHPYLRSPLLVEEDDQLLSIPLLHPLHYLFTSRASTLRRHLLMERRSEAHLFPSTVSSSDAWIPAPLLKNSQGCWGNYVHVILHLMQWEINRIKQLLSKMDVLDSKIWKLNWSALHFPNTRTIHPYWSSEGEFLLQVGLFPHRGFQFVRPLLSHHSALQFLTSLALQSENSKLGFLASLMRSCYPNSRLHVIFHSKVNGMSVSLDKMINDWKYWGARD